jgi:hypothetical protein
MQNRGKFDSLNWCLYHLLFVALDLIVASNIIIPAIINKMYLSVNLKMPKM